MDRRTQVDKARQPQRPHPERSDLIVGTNRCPFCHDDIQIEASDWVACFNCQARHHRTCWVETGACGSCGETRFVAEAADVQVANAQRSEASEPTGNPRIWALASGLILVLCSILALLKGWPLSVIFFGVGCYLWGYGRGWWGARTSS